MGLLQRMAAVRTPERSIATLDDYISAVQQSVYGYNGGVTQTIGGQPAE
jgi:hypothetical protein